MEGQTDRGKTVYPPPPLGSGGIINYAYSFSGLGQQHQQLQLSYKPLGYGLQIVIKDIFELVIVEFQLAPVTFLDCKYF